MMPTIRVKSGQETAMGAVFALAEAEIMLATVVQHYTLTIEDERLLIPAGRLTIQPSHAPTFKLERAPFAVAKGHLPAHLRRPTTSAIRSLAANRT
jgi:hypothetical protein